MPGVAWVENPLYDAEDDDDDDELQVITGATGVGKKTRNVKTAATISRAVASTGVAVARAPITLAQAASVVGTSSSAISTAAGFIAPAAPILGPAGLSFAAIDIGLSAKSAHSTYKHVKFLKELLTQFPDAAESIVAAIEYTIRKKNKKLAKKSFGCVPIVGSIGNSFFRAGKALYKHRKGTKGVHRRFHAMNLWRGVMQGDGCACAASEDLMGNKTFSKARIYADGFLLLEKKMKSI